MLENKNAVKMSKLLDDFVKENDLVDDVLAERIRTNWSKITSKSFAKNVKVESLIKGNLKLSTDVSTWRTEVALHKSEIATFVNNFLGTEVVQSVEIH